MTKLARPLVVLLLFACATTQPPKPFVVDEATRAGIRQLNDALAQVPTHTPWIYVLATLHDKARETPEVVRWLTRLDELGWEHGVNPIDFRNTRDDAAFKAIAAKLEAREPHVHNARVAFTLKNQRDLVPEGIAYDPVDDVFYVSGIYRRKVLRVTRDGRATDFVKEQQDGMLGGLGVKVDAKRRLLWVISSTTPEMRGHVEGKDASMLAAYDLRDGKLVKLLDPAPGRLNDLTLLEDGSLYATDMGRHKVVRLPANGDKLEEWEEGFNWPNGIAVSDDQRTLYVADFRGLHRIDLADKSKRDRILPRGKLLNGIDGLTFHNNTLIGIQNSIGKPRVVRVHLSDNRVEILEAKNATFDLPTTGAVAGAEYFFIANPGLRSFTDGKIWATAKLKDPVMLKLQL